MAQSRALLNCARARRDLISICVRNQERSCDCRFISPSRNCVRSAEGRLKPPTYVIGNRVCLVNVALLDPP